MLDALHTAIEAVAPIDGVSVGSRADKSSWRVAFKPEATDEQKAAAASVVAAFNPLTIHKSELRKKVDDDAERERLRYITPGAGMAMTYQEKKDQAVAVIAMGEAAANALPNNGAQEFPTLSASVPVEASSLYAAAQVVIARYEAWAAISRGIELARMNGKKSISDASDAAAAQAAYEAITWPNP